MRLLIWIIMLSAFVRAASLPLVFEGNEALSDSELYTALAITSPYQIEFSDLNATLPPTSIFAQSISALRGVYRKEGFYHVLIVPKIAQNNVIFTIYENAPVQIESVEIKSVLDIHDKIDMVVGEVFKEQAFVEAKSKVTKYYTQKGYCNATLRAKTWIDISSNRAKVLFEVLAQEPCVFGPITIQSTANIHGDMLRPLLRFKSGDRYNPDLIRQSYDVLYAQEAISQVSMNDSDRQGNMVPIAISFQEVSRPIHLDMGAGYDTDQGIMGLFGWKHRNFLGDLKTLSLTARYTQIIQEVYADFALPLQNRSFFQATTGYRNQLYKGYEVRSHYEKLTAAYKEIHSSSLVGALIDQTQTYNSDDLISFPENSLFIISPLAEFNYDIRDKPLEPTQGYWLNAKIQGSIKTPTVSDATYVKSLLSAAHIQTLIDTHILASRVRWGTVRVYEGDIPPSYRFYAGGMNSNRAYPYQRLGPKNTEGDPVGFMTMLEGTLEYRFPISGAFRGVLFTDMTFVSNNYVPEYSHPYTGAGVGIRYVTPIGPISIDAGIDPRDTGQYAIHFRIGELF